MSVYLGTLGRMVGIKCPASQQLSMDGDPSFQTTLEGRRKAQVSQSAGRRAWQNQLSDASTPEQIAEVMAFINREWGAGPFVFVSADAPVTNMITPAVASCDPSTNFDVGVDAAGPMRLPDGSWAGRSFLRTAPGNILFGRTRAPVLPGVPVTGSVVVLGEGAAARISWYTDDPDSTQALIGHTVSPVKGVAGAPVRSWVTALPPATAAGCIIAAVDAVQATRPAVTWTDSLFDWADGQGCAQAVIHGASRDLVMASRDPRGGRYSNLSFTISEVG